MNLLNKIKNRFRIIESKVSKPKIDFKSTDEVTTSLLYCNSYNNFFDDMCRDFSSIFITFEWTNDNLISDLGNFESLLTTKNIRYITRTHSEVKHMIISASISELDYIVWCLSVSEFSKNSYGFESNKFITGIRDVIKLLPSSGFDSVITKEILDSSDFTYDHNLVNMTKPFRDLVSTVSRDINKISFIEFDKPLSIFENYKDIFFEFELLSLCDAIFVVEEDYLEDILFECSSITKKIEDRDMYIVRMNLRDFVQNLKLNFEDEDIYEEFKSDYFNINGYNIFLYSNVMFFINTISMVNVSEDEENYEIFSEMQKLYDDIDEIVD